MTAQVEFDGAQALINYTDRDFTALVASGRGYVIARFPQLTDFNTNSRTQMTIELFAAVGDRLFFMQDRQATETNIFTARLRRNVLIHARKLGYQFTSRRAASTTILAELDQEYVGDLTIQKGQIIYTKEASNPQAFQLQEDLVIIGGETEGEALVKNSLEWVEDFESDGSASQVFQLQNSPYLDDESAVITVNSVEWEQVETFLDSGALDLHYVIIIDENEVASLAFGDGVNGKRPPTDAEIQITYQTGGGLAGNQVADAITVNREQYVTDEDEAVLITWTNEDPATGGDDQESTDLIRVRAPRSVATNRRTIAESDFSYNVEQYPGVARAIGFSSDQMEGIPEYTAWVYVVPVGGGAAGTSLRNSIYTYLTTPEADGGRPIPMGMGLQVLDGIFASVAPKGKVYIHPNADFARAKAAVIANLELFFDYRTRLAAQPWLYTINWGQPIRWSNISYVILGSYGVKYLEDFVLNALDPQEDFEMEQNEIAALDDSGFDEVDGLEFVVAE